MEDSDLERLFENGIIVDSSLKDKEIGDVDELISSLKKKNISILDAKTLYDIFREKKRLESLDTEAITDYKGEITQSKPQDWIAFFNARYEQLKSILIDRADPKLLISAAGFMSVPDGSDVEIIGMVSNISISPVKKYQIIDIEDPTGQCRIISRSVNDEILKDQVLLFKGRKIKEAIFLDDVTFPDIKLRNDKVLNIGDTYVAFISDVHVGSSLFAEEQFKRFISWLKGEVGEYKDIAEKMRFLVINGDLVDGIGIYPGQEKELKIKDIRSQYDELYSLLAEIPKNIKIIITQGNHDATRIAEPQPHIDPMFGGSLYLLDNAVFLSNPSLLNLKVDGSKRTLLLYHGFSISYFVNNINKFNSMRPEDILSIMRLMLKSRHLAPVHGSAQVVPLRKDYLVIEDTPDIFATGHVHKAAISKYKDTIILNSSCWQFQTSYQKKYGIVPEVAKVPIVNLRDKSYFVLDFLGPKIQEYKGGSQ
mgnify:CR=1 FL=1